MGDYQQLSVWKQAHAFALEVYRSSASFPESERFGLVLNCGEQLSQWSRTLPKDPVAGQAAIKAGSIKWLEDLCAKSSASCCSPAMWATCSLSLGQS